jgi:hypothetical protein
MAEAAAASVRRSATGRLIRPGLVRTFDVVMGIGAAAWIVVLLWLVLALPLGLCFDSGPPIRKVRNEVESPDGEHVAAVVSVSGGGAAGYLYEQVVLRRRDEVQGTTLAERVHGSTVTWSDQVHLQVACEAATPGPTDCDGIVVSYRLR